VGRKGQGGSHRSKNWAPTEGVTAPQRLLQEQVEEAVAKYRKFLSDNGAVIVHENNWGLRKLAYPIQKKSTGFYFLFEFQADPTLIAKMEVEYKRDERIMRFLTIALDKHAIAYNERKRKNASQKKQEESVN